MAAQFDELARQRALDVYRVVDTLPEVAYNDIVQIASILCDVPMALMSLVDRDRQWFKASRGMDTSSTHRDIAFCAHAIEAPTALMEVPDATRDPRFIANPLVTGSLGLRFYAGMPLVTPSGEAIGTVVVLDKKPRELNQRQREGLQALSRLTMTLWPVTNVVSEKSITASRCRVWVRVAASRSTCPCCSSGIRAPTAICLTVAVTPILRATTRQRSTS